jgi:nicotinate-nucleotide pyrophosphorylase (carboxylating)
MSLDEFIINALAEDVGAGDHTALACIDAASKGKAKLLVKDKGIIAGVALAEQIFKIMDPTLVFEKFMEDGMHIKNDDVVFHVSGHDQKILTAERLVLNCMQRMSAIATLTNRFVEEVKSTNAKILDTRKTTPLCRIIEKWAVKIGGGYNHRFGLYDMIMIKDNHIDFCGGIKQAIEKTQQYLDKKDLHLKIEVETRSLKEVREVMEIGGIDRIMLDNFSTELMTEAVTIINGKYETEASGGIKLNNVRAYALTGVDYISVGALTHSVSSLDLSLKAIK